MADTMQMHETLCLVISAALGSGSNDADVSEAPKTKEELQAAMTNFFG